MPDSPCAVLVLTMVTLCGCSPIRVACDYDPDADFTAVATFDWSPDFRRPTGDPLVDSTLLDERIRHAVAAHLEQRGLRRVTSEDPDVWVAYHAALHQNLAASAMLEDHGHGTGRNWDSQVDIYTYEEGLLLVDILDPRTSRLLWRGYAQASVDLFASREEKTARIDEAVRQVLGLFPPPEQ